MLFHEYIDFTVIYTDESIFSKFRSLHTEEKRMQNPLETWIQTIVKTIDSYLLDVIFGLKWIAFRFNHFMIIFLFLAHISRKA